MSPTQARSTTTRARILSAAQAQFAKDGYERATIRAVASLAGTDPALVIRYYGSKEGLFAAATHFDLCLPSLDHVAHADIGETLVRHFLALWEGNPADPSLRILLRAAVTHAEAATRIRGLFAEQVLPAIRVVAPDRPALRAGLVASQILGLALCRYILEVPPLVDMKPDDVIACIAPTLQRYLAAPLDGGFTANA
ncbi:MAG: TetR family transcriptional regulator [Rhodospirillales bacterium 20-64-7]|nr:MAG: TetR family transcriptional regulator [Rhodospirillales bacterium 20-64-7]HQT76161.1 TetR family transcriptional regulator [Rhodopila sp.]